MLRQDGIWDAHLDNFEVVVNKSRRSPELRKALDAEPAVLPAWHPMEALAQGCPPAVGRHGQFGGGTSGKGSAE